MHDAFECALLASSVQMCEDMPMQLDKDIPGLGERPVNVFLPRLLHVSSFLCAILGRAENSCVEVVCS